MARVRSDAHAPFDGETNGPANGSISELKITPQVLYCVGRIRISDRKVETRPGVSGGVKGTVSSEKASSCHRALREFSSARTHEIGRIGQESTPQPRLKVAAFAGAISAIDIARRIKGKASECGLRALVGKRAILFRRAQQRVRKLERGSVEQCSNQGAGMGGDSSPGGQRSDKI